MNPRQPAFEPVQLKRCLRLGAEIFRLHEAGATYSEQLRELSQRTGASLTAMEVDHAFGSTDSDEWVRDLLLRDATIPADVLEDELIAMLDRVCRSEVPDWLAQWYLRCVEKATGCPDVFDIVYYPRDLFGDDEHDDLSPTQILAAARTMKRRVIVTPPPSESGTGSETAG